jgi:N-acetyl-anhydromuramyl-L-alanine amidase AmpD
MIYQKPARIIHSVFIHCSDSDYDHHDDISVIRKWHVQERNWSDVGYHYFIKKDGTIQRGRDLNTIPAAQRGHNTGSIAICLSGKEQFTEHQFRALRRLCDKIAEQHEYLKFRGHREVDPHKSCPNFEYKTVLGLDTKGRLPKLKFEERNHA